MLTILCARVCVCVCVCAWLGRRLPVPHETAQDRGQEGRVDGPLEDSEVGDEHTSQNVGLLMGTRVSAVDLHGCWRQSECDGDRTIVFRSSLLWAASASFISASTSFITLNSCTR